MISPADLDELDKLTERSDVFDRTTIRSLVAEIRRFRLGVERIGEVAYDSDAPYAAWMCDELLGGRNPSG